MTSRRMAVLCLATLILAAAPAHAASKYSETDALKEGHVVWYTTLLDEATGPLVAAFEKRHPEIAVEVTRKNGSALLRAILDETNAHALKTDVFDGTTTADTLMQMQLVQAWHAPSAADIPAQYKDSNGYWTAQVLYFQTLGYNADLVPESEAPKTYEDLLDPKWKGKLAWSIDEDSLTGGMGFIANAINAMGERKGMAYLRALAAQDIAVIPSGINGVTLALANKQYAVGAAIDNHHTLIANAKGAHVRWVPADPVLALSNNIGLMAGAPHPNAAMMLIDFNLSVEGQTILRNANHVPANSKVEARDPALKQGFRSVYVRPALVPFFMRLGHRAYDQIWKAK